MSYDKVHPGGWFDKPNTSTPVDADALNHMEQALSDIADQADAALPAPATATAGILTRASDGTLTWAPGGGVQDVSY